MTKLEIQNVSFSDESQTAGILWVNTTNKPKGDYSNNEWKAKY